MSKKTILPFMKFYPADWIQDIQILSLEAQGAWIKILCALHVAPKRGRKTWLMRELKHFLGYPEDDRSILLLNELCSVANIEGLDSDGNFCEDFLKAAQIIIISRRMIRDEAERIRELKRKERYETKHPERRRKSDANPTERRRKSDGQKSEVRSQISEEESPIVPLKGDDDGFFKFWNLYPRKIGKGAAEKAWKKIRPSNGTVGDILSAVENQKHWPIWERDNGQYIPNPATWLNQKRWADEGQTVSDDLSGPTTEQILAELKAKRRRDAH